MRPNTELQKQRPLKHRNTISPWESKLAMFQYKEDKKLQLRCAFQKHATEHWTSKATTLETQKHTKRIEIPKAQTTTFCFLRGSLKCKGEKAKTFLTSEVAKTAVKASMIWMQLGFCSLMILFWVNVMNEQTQKNKHSYCFLNIFIQNPFIVYPSKNFANTYWIVDPFTQVNRLSTWLNPK